MNTPTTTIAIDERACAAAIGMSVAWLRKDRRGARVIPFYKLGDCVRYDIERVRQALQAQCEMGGAKGKRTGVAAS